MRRVERLLRLARQGGSQAQATYTSSTSNTSTFTSNTLPRVSEVFHPTRVRDNTLHPHHDCIIPEVSYCSYIWDNLSQHEHLPGLVCGVTGRTLLHGQVREEALRVSAALRGLGLAKGEVVAILLPNCLEYMLLVQGALHSGLAITPINPSYTAPEISRQLAASGATVLVTHTDIADKVAATLALYPSIRATVTVGGGERAGAVGWEDFVRSSSDPDPQQVEVDLRRDVAVMPFSSGTTGVPKGVMLSQHNLVDNMPYYSIPCHTIPYHPISYHFVPYRTIPMQWYDTIPRWQTTPPSWPTMTSTWCAPSG